MFFRICSAALLTILPARRIRPGPNPSYRPSCNCSRVPFRSLFKLPDPRGEFVRLCAPHMVGRWAHPEDRLQLPARLCGRDRRGHRPARSLAPRHQRDRRAHDRDRLGAAVKAVRDRRDLHQDRQADAAMHVRAVDELDPQSPDAHLPIELVAGSTRRWRPL